jgi:hypothetical protein
MSAIRGGCLCGGIKFEIPDPYDARDMRRLHDTGEFRMTDASIHVEDEIRRDCRLALTAPLGEFSAERGSYLSPAEWSGNSGP